MFGEEILSMVKGIGDTVIKAIDEFHASPEEKMEFKLKVQQMMFDSQSKAAELHVQDLNSARNREIQVKDKTVSTLAFMIVGAFVSMAAFMIVHPYVWPGIKIEPEMIGLIGTVVGYLAAK